MTTTPLTARTSIKGWLAHPEGGPVLRGLLAQSGFEENVLAPIADLPLQQLVVMSQGQMPQSVIDGLVQQVNGGSMPIEEEAQAVLTPSDGRFTGKTVIVTGSGSGVGRETSIRVVSEGGRVIGVDIAGDRLDELEGTLPDGTFVPVRGNITVQDDVDRIIAAAGDRIDGLANAAGINDNFSPTHETSDALWNRVMSINVTGAFLLMRAALPAMLDRGAGAIVNVSSEAGLRGNASGTAYTTSKHALIGLTRSTAFMYGHRGVRTNAVAPGVYRDRDGPRPGVAVGIRLVPARSVPGAHSTHRASRSHCGGHRVPPEQRQREHQRTRLAVRRRLVGPVVDRGESPA